MRNLPAILLASVVASPAFASEEEPFFSLGNHELIEIVALLLFIGVLVYLKVPGLLGKALDNRAAGIQSELDEARALRDEAQELLASYERRQREVKDQAARIVEHARKDAELAAEQAREDLKASIARRLAAAEEKIASAQSAAVKDVRDKAIAVAVAAARDVIAQQMTAAQSEKLVSEAISEVGAKLH